MLKTVKELCLVCGGERWLPDVLDPARSVACRWCDQLGWVEISLPSLGEAPPPPPGPAPGPGAAPQPKPSRKRP
jgi:hypothetical protein